jgi:exopolysaccharide biosynthesis polyprenyl glycosylphosphotransferase
LTSTAPKANIKSYRSSAEGLHGVSKLAPDSPGAEARGAEEPRTDDPRGERAHRLELMEELLKRYGGGKGRQSWRYLRKRYAWILITGSARVIKRAFDLSVALTMLLLCLPILAVVALLIKLTDRGPILFWQARVGRWGKEFPFPKFRSMVRNAEDLKDDLAEASEHDDPRTFKMKKDPRVTTIGRFIRKTSIDELPQIWNVLKGEMSIVGPRPPVPKEVALYTLSDRRRLDVTPGLTCIWQVSGRGDIPFPKQVELDVKYIESQSLWLDLKILLATIPAVLFGKGAY